MVSVLVVERTGELTETIIKAFSFDDLYKSCKFRKKEGFEQRSIWKTTISGEEINIALYSRDYGKSGMENKYDLPPPIDNQLYFGAMVLVQVKHGTDGLTVCDLDKSLWNTVYEKLFGGFDNLDETVDEDNAEVDELINIPAEYKTKGGYLKDGFVIEDNNSSIENTSDASEASFETDNESELNFEEYEYLDDSEEEDEEDNEEEADDEEEAESG